ncbi:MAG: YhbY family RNA-binding protein [Candidatus Woesearchaeota archaeon]|jgi:RNA-binding protein YhbY
MNLQDNNSVTLQLGKKGISDTFYVEIIKSLKQNKLVKIKMLNNSLVTGNKDEYSEQIILEMKKTMDLESKVVGKTLFLKKISVNQPKKEATY